MTAIHYRKIAVQSGSFVNLVCLDNSILNDAESYIVNNPSIISLDYSASYGSRTVWLSEPTDGASGINNTLRTVWFRDPANPTQHWEFGSNVACPTITNASNNGYRISWSQFENGAWNDYWVDNTLSADNIMQITNGHGKYFALTNGQDNVDARAIVQTGSAAPYVFETLPLVSGIQQPVAASAGIQGNVYYDDGSAFFFSLGDISVDGAPAYFVPVDPTVSFNSAENLNQYTVSKNFYLTGGSNFLYSVHYGATALPFQGTLFPYGNYLNFKVELLDALTDEVLGTYDNVTYNAENSNLGNGGELSDLDHDAIMYSVDCSGIGNRMVKLRLVITNTWDTPGGGYELGEIMDPVQPPPGMPKFSAMSKTQQMNFLLDNGVIARNAKKIRTITYKGKLLGESGESVTEYALTQNYPNPFNPTTTFSYQIPKTGLVSLIVYDALGRELITLVNEEKAPGKYSVEFNASNLPSGVYFYTLRSGDFVSTKKMILVK
jgi:hypothetical protein